jgi:hypothetical protein
MDRVREAGLQKFRDNRKHTYATAGPKGLIVTLNHQRAAEPGRREVVALKGFNLRGESWLPAVAFDLNSTRPLPDWIQSTADCLVNHWLGDSAEPPKSALRLCRRFPDFPEFEESAYLRSVAGRHLPEMCKSPLTGVIKRITDEPENGMVCLQIIADEQLEEIHLPSQFGLCVEAGQAINVGEKLCPVEKMTRTEYEKLGFSETTMGWMLFEAFRQLIVSQADGSYLGDHRLFKEAGILEWEAGVQRVDFSWELQVHPSAPKIDLKSVPAQFARYFTPYQPNVVEQAPARKYASAG